MTDEAVFNGIDLDTGEPLHELLGRDVMARAAVSASPDPDHLAAVVERHRKRERKDLGLTVRARADRLAEAGWGWILARELEGSLDRIRDALRPLLDRREGEAGGRYREYVGNDAPLATGARPESALEFAARHGQGPDPVDPKRMPYYLMIVASPEQLPYHFQYQLDSQFAVGRVWFDDDQGGLDLAALRRYAESVVAAEEGQIRLPRRAAFFGARNRNDKATELSHDGLVGPLADEVIADSIGWEVRKLLAADATKANLADQLTGPERPALLFSATHGGGFASPTPETVARQRALQGALICQDWPGKGPLGKAPLKEDHYFAARDVTDDARPAGMVAFLFACYGAGTPRAGDFAHEAPVQEKVPAPSPTPFVARLPQRLLSHPDGGALAVVGQVERAWAYSFQWGRAGFQNTAFGDALFQLLKGQPVGRAMEGFAQRFERLSTARSDLRDLYDAGGEIETGGRLDPEELSILWTAINDARSYAVVGDPAVRLAVAKGNGG